MQDMDFPMIGRSNPTHSGEASMPAIQSCFIEPIWDQFSALLPTRPGSHTLGCHRPRVSDRLVFDKLSAPAQLEFEERSGRRDSNSRHPAWKAYSRFQVQSRSVGVSERVTSVPDHGAKTGHNFREIVH